MILATEVIGYINAVLARIALAANRQQSFLAPCKGFLRVIEQEGVVLGVCASEGNFARGMDLQPERM